MQNLRLPFAFARTHGVLLGEVTEEHAQVLAREDASPAAFAELRRLAARPLKIQTLGKGAFEARLSENYSQGESSAAEVAADVGQDIDVSQLMQEMPVVGDLLEAEDDAPIIRMINALLTQAVRERASDIHIEPYENYSVVRLRRDGVLVEVARPHRALHAAMSSRIKIMASLDIAEKRLPQDGRISVRLAGRAIDVRVSTLPTSHGERIVLRLLDKDATQFGLDHLGMATDTRVRFDALLSQPHGILLVTGPTGSGKTTTLYAALRTLDGHTRNIVTVEDPVEYDLPGVGQIQVNARIELTFARALRSILRQDPDVIMIGEIRDLETAQIAVQASLTGHMVLATLHTNDAPSAVTRLIDMGVEPFLLASTLRGALAQRLVRRLCPQCREAYAPSASDREELGDACPPMLWKPVGCKACGHTGYSGRTGVYELLTVDDAVQRLIHDQAAESDLRRSGHANGMRALREDGMRLLAEGGTSVEELLRVTRD